MEFKLESKKYKCTMEFNQKLTFIRGDSGQGKTELIRRLSSGSKSNTIITSNDFEVVVLTKQIFEQSYKFALKHKNSDKTDLSFLKSYWNNSENFPYDNSIIFIDDEDFVKSHEFAVFYESDRSNYYVIINRGDIPSLSYSVSEIYEFVSRGREHWIQRLYDYSLKTLPKIDEVIVEGIGSDYVFFSNLFKEKRVINPTTDNMMLGGGRSNVVTMLEKFHERFRHRRLFLLIDYCAFGSDIDRLINVCENYGLEVFLNEQYLSFEFLLLKSNFIDDQSLDNFINKHVLEFASLELLFTQRLFELTKDTYYRYDKSSSKFAECYYKNCCIFGTDRFDCIIRKTKMKENKIFNMLNGTEFEYLLFLSSESFYTISSDGDLKRSDYF